MVFVHDQSCKCVKSELDVCSVSATQTGINYDNYVDYHPLSNMSDSGLIDFDVSSSGQNHLDFSNTQLLVKAKLATGATEPTLPMLITKEVSSCFYTFYSIKWVFH